LLLVSATMHRIDIADAGLRRNIILSLKFSLKSFPSQSCRWAVVHCTEVGAGGTAFRIDRKRKWKTPEEPAKLRPLREKSMQIRSFLTGVFILASPWAAAQTAEAPPALSLDEARAWQVKGKALKSAAEARYIEDKAVCQDKIVAFNCLSSAKERHSAAVKEATALEQGGRKAEREIRRLEREAKTAKRQAEAPAREAKAQVDVERHREKEALRAAERERSRTEAATSLEARRSKAAAERAAQQQRLAERRKEDAERAQKAPENARKAAERKRQHAELVKKIDERERQYAELLKRREAEAAAKQAAAATARDK
jgi:colicin import membrane protein